MNFSQGICHGFVARFLAIALVSAAIYGYALDPERNLSQYSRSQWTIQDGLPQSTVFCGLQDREGFLWVGTQEGLVRFDGVKFDVFDRNNVKSLRDHSVSALIEDRQGRLWLGTERGLYVKEGPRFRGIAEATDLADILVWALAEDHRGRIWVGTEKHGLLVYEDEELKPAPEAWGFKGKMVYALLVTKPGELWVGGSAGLCRIQEDEARWFSQESGFDFGDVYFLAGGGDGDLWLSTNSGLAHFKDGVFELFTEEDGLVSDDIYSIYEDPSGSVWIGTAYGLCRLRDGVVDLETPGEEKRYNPINFFLEDRENNLWAGRTNDGLFCYRDGPLATFAVEEGLGHNMVRAIVEDSSGQIVIGTDQGVNFFDGETFRLMTTEDGLADNVIASLAVGPDGAVWIGGTNGTITRVLGAERRKFEIGLGGMPNNMICALTFDGQGRLWIGSETGIEILESGRMTRPDGPLATESNMVVQRDPQGTIWVSTSNRAGYYENGDPQKFRELSLPKSAEILCFHRDGKGVVWMGTYGSGLWRFDGANVAMINREQGLFDNTIFSILEDSGYLWMSSNHGIFKVPLEDLDAVANGRANDLSTVAFGTAEGMKSAECNGATWPAAIRTRDGHFWYATTRGAVRLRPGSLETQLASPKVHIMSVRAKGETYHRDSTPVFEAGPDQVAITYTAPTFNQPENVVFRYRMKGYEEDWRYVGDRRTAYYNHLPAGEYRFEVSAARRDGTWSNPAESMKLTLSRVWWQIPMLTWLIVALMLLLVIFLTWLRLRRSRSNVAALGHLVEETEGQVNRLDRAWDHIQVEYLAAVTQAGVGEMAGKVLHTVSQGLGDIQYRILTVEELARNQNTSNRLKDLKIALAARGSSQHPETQSADLSVEPSLKAIVEDLEERQDRMLSQVVALRDEIHAIGEMVEVQQNYAILDEKEDLQNLHALVADVLRMHVPFLQKYRISFRKVWVEFPPIKIHILKLFLTITGMIRYIAIANARNRNENKEGLIQIKRVDRNQVEIGIWAPEGEKLEPIEASDSRMNFLKELQWSYGSDDGLKLQCENDRYGYRLRIDEIVGDTQAMKNGGS